MKYHVIEAFKVRISHEERAVLPGQIISLSGDKAEKLITTGKIRPHDSDLNGSEAERQAWCWTSCMLSFPSQWKECERFKPNPCRKLMNQKSDNAEVIKGIR